MARRLTKELAEFEKSSPDWCTVSAVDDDLMHWNAMLAGPFPSEYPFKAPKVRFLTRVYHPNVKSQSGEICADVINENWGPTLNVLHCLTAIKQILEQPDMDNPLEPEIAKQMHENKADFEKTAEDWTKQYAS
ncbi:Ubiquitin-conjugating enzyme/RWD-like [Phytophthora cactorum]|nr:Ubiquitin-conjugating enzyme/RWD-like [Phytophthora cactorum]